MSQNQQPKAPKTNKEDAREHGGGREEGGQRVLPPSREVQTTFQWTSGYAAVWS